MTDIETTERQLDRILAFFPRVEGRITSLFAAVTILMSFTAINISYVDLQKWYVSVPAFVLTVTLLLAYYFLYKANFPDVKGGHDSIIYFAEIQKRTEKTYIDRFEAVSDDEYRRDLLGQIWRNSQILSDKYKNIRFSIYCLAVSILPFSIILLATTVMNARLPIVQD